MPLSFEQRLAGSTDTRKETIPKNVLLIIADALRADRLGCYGYSKNTSPNVDRIAQEGIRFQNCIATSTHTVPSMLSILTGRNSVSHGILTANDYGEWISDDSQHSKVGPVQDLLDAGISADGQSVLDWQPLGFSRNQDDIPSYFNRNCDSRWFYIATPYATHLPYNPPQEYFDLFVADDFQPSEETQKRMEIARTTMICHPPGTVSAMEVGQPEPFPNDDLDEAHQRTAASVAFQPEDAPGISALYDGGVREFDDWLGEHIAVLEESGTLDDTLILILSDHGEELLERGHVGHASCNLSGTLYEESLKTPLIIRYPKRLPGGNVIESQVSHIDLMPTILELLGVKTSTPTEGASLLPLIEGNTDFSREEAYACVPPAGWQRLLSDQRLIGCVRTNSWKLIVNVDLSKGIKEYELYNLQHDPGELQNIYSTQAQNVEPLKRKLDSYLQNRPSA